MSSTADQVVLRPPTFADVAAAAHCHMSSWQEAYGALVDAERLAEVTSDLDRAMSWWRKALESERTVTLAVDGDAIVGFATAGRATEPDLDVALQLYAINVRRAYWGTGVGQRLLDAAIGDRDAFLWVFRDNLRARAFYVRNGFVPDGAEQVEDFFGPIEILMVRRRAAGG